MFDPARVPSAVANSYCPTKCNRNGVDKQLSDSKVSGVLSSASAIYGFNDIKNALVNFQRQPIVSQMELYEDMDFYFAKSNIYRHTTG